MKFYVTRTLLATLCATASLSASAAIVNIAASKDVGIRQNTDTQDDTAFVPISDANNGNGVRRALIQFDISGLPAGQLIDSAILSITQAGPTPAFDGEVTLEVYRLTKDWVETEVRWTEAATGDAWTTPGGDVDPILITSVSTTYTFDTQVDFDITGLVQDWYDGTSDNFGVLIRDNGFTTNDKFAFASRTHGGATTAAEPVLTIDYSPIPEPGSLALLALGGMFVVRRRR